VIARCPADAVRREPIQSANARLQYISDHVLLKVKTDLA